MTVEPILMCRLDAPELWKMHRLVWGGGRRITVHNDQDGLRTVVAGGGARMIPFEYIEIPSIRAYNNSNRAYLGGGIQPTVMENHGKVTLILVEVRE